MAFRPFVVERGRPLRVAVAVAPDMGATAAVNTLLPLVERLAPRCVAMCGVCAGRRSKVALGDVVAADRVYYHDTGKQRRRRVEQDLKTYNVRDDWKAALEGMDAVARFRDEAWFQARPLTTEWRLHRALVALHNGAPKPWQAVDPAPGGADEWPKIVAALRERKFLASSGDVLTKAGRQFVEDLLFRYQGALPALSPDGTLQPFRLHVAPLGSGARVIEDERIWTFVSQAMRKTLGIEMEAAAIAELAHRQRQHKLDWVVMKGVMDFADHGRDDHFKEFAARASAECLLWFLRDHVATELTAGFDDLLTPGTLPLPDRVPAPSMLLNARYAVVPWHEVGRSEILADLDAWADDPSRPVAMQLLHAEGGAGKTRLAIEWVRRRRGRYDAAGFLVPAPDSRWLERLCSLGPPVIIVIDYAESRADLESVLERVVAFGTATGQCRRVRVLLLARSDGDWWKALLQRHLALAALQGGEPIKLLPLAATLNDREAVLVEASRAFAARTQLPRVLVSPTPLDDARFERVLYLHIAALAAVEGARAEVPPGNTTSTAPTTVDASLLMDEILAHEERFWTREASDRTGRAIDLPLARQLVVVATLRGGLATKSEARKLCERLEDRPRERADDALIALLHDIYDRGDPEEYLPGLEPDLLGEGLVQRVVAPPPGAGDPAGDTWIERVVVAGDDARAVTAAFTVLGRASAANLAAVRLWIETMLRSELAVRAQLALRAAKAVGRQITSSSLGDVLAEVLERNGSISIALALAKEQIPHPTVSLRRVAAWISRMELEHAPTGDDEHSLATRAELLLEHGLRLSDLGERSPALVTTREAVHLCRTLAARNPDAFQHYLAAAVNNLSLILSELGQRESALAAAGEAVNIFRRIAARDPDAFQPDLAKSLTNLSIDLSALGRRELSLAAAHESVELYRVLAAHNTDTFKPELAMSLNNLGIALSELGQRDPAFAATREAADLYRALAAGSLDAFQPDLAMSLSNLGNRLSELGQHEPAFVAAREAADVYRGLAARNSEAFQPALAMSLNNLGNRFSDLGEHKSALAATREAVDLYRTLKLRNPDAFQRGLAGGLHNVGTKLSALGQHDAALAATREAVELRRALVAGNPDAYKSDLAMSLNHLGNILSELGEREPALAATREAVDVYRALTADHPDAFQPDLAMSLHNLSNRWSALDQIVPALAAAQESVDLYRTLAIHHPAAFRSNLARGLDKLGARFHELGERELAVAAIDEAAAIRRAQS